MIYDKASLVQIPSGYKSGTLYNVLPNDADGDFDFTRGSTATRVDENGLIETIAIGTPRLNYPLLDGVVQDNPTLLLEPQRSNIFINSEIFSYLTSVNGASASNTNETNSPKGDLTADLLVSSAIGNVQGIYRTITFISGVTHTISVFAKSKEVKVLQLQGGGSGWGANTYVNFDLENGVFEEGAGIISNSAFMTKMPNGWYRCGFSASTVGTSANVSFDLVNNVTDVRDAAFNGTIGDGLYLWGAMVEAYASYPTSYIPTGGSTVTRSADVANGAGTADDFNDSEGVLYANVANIDTSVQSRLSLNSGNATTNKIHIGYNPSNTKIELFIIDGSNSTVVNSQGLITDNNSKIAVNYSSSSFFGYVNGFKTAIGTARTPSGFDDLSFNRGDSVVNFYGKAKEVIAFNEALSDTELEALTSYDSFNSMATELLFTIE